MIPTNKKIERMITVSRMYYEQDMTQSQIAKALEISRPLVSNLLSEAKACGIVTIHIQEIENQEDLLAKQLINRFGLKNALVIPDRDSADATDREISAAAYQLCFQGDCPYEHVGIGWGSMMGRMADFVETLTETSPRQGNIFPLIGGITASYRGYHPNEIVRIISVNTGLSAEYLYSPAIFESEAELDFFRGMANSRSMEEKWSQMDLAVVSISNYPSYPDLGVKYRYNDELSRQKALGRLLAHYYTENGTVIDPVIDNVFQASIAQLRSTPAVVAVCSTLLRPQSVIGALNLNVIDTLVLPASLAESILNF